MHLQLPSAVYGVTIRMPSKSVALSYDIIGGHHVLTKPDLAFN